MGVCRVCWAVCRFLLYVLGLYLWLWFYTAHVEYPYEAYPSIGQVLHRGDWPFALPWVRRHVTGVSDASVCGSRAGLAAESNVSSKVKVLLVMIGQTGTTTVCQALASLGLRVYHMEEMMVFARGAFRVEATPGDWARALSRCRVDAVSLEPNLDQLPVALAASPDAKVILTFRPVRAWFKSTMRTGPADRHFDMVIGRYLFGGLRMFPLLDVWDALTGQYTRIMQEGDPFMMRTNVTLLEMIAWFSIWRPCYAFFDLSTRGTMKVMRDTQFEPHIVEEPYLAYKSEIKRLVPKDRLLVFDVTKHNMTHLRDFLGKPAPPGAEQALPRSIRTKHEWSNDGVWINMKDTQLYALVGMALSGHLAGYAIVAAVCRGLAALLCRRVLRPCWAACCRRPKSKAA